jgi:Uma2 family endonuclease
MTLAAPPAEDRFVLYDVDWDFYESLLERLQDRHVFATYDHGTLELMSPSYKHDKTARLLCRLIWELAEEMDLPISSAGTTTLRHKDKKVGLEPDECFYLKNEPVVRGKDEIDLLTDPPPDLAVEVEISRRLGTRKDLYAELGIPELWQYRDGEIVISLLGEDRRYTQVSRSPSFPQIPMEEIARFIETGRNSDGTTWIRSFRVWLRELLRHPTQGS